MLYLMAGVLAYSLTGPSAEIVTGWNPFLHASCRSIVAAMVIGLVGRHSLRLPQLHDFKTGGVGAVLVSVFVLATKWSSATHAITLLYTAPIFALLLEAFTQRRWPPFRRLIAVAFVGAGLLVLVGQAGDPPSWKAIAAGLSGALSFACWLMLRARQQDKDAYTSLLVAFCLGAAITFAAHTVFPTTPSYSAAASSSAGIVLGGVLAALAFHWTGRAANRVKPSMVAIVSTLEVPLMPLWEWICFGRVPSHETLMSTTLILVGVLLSMYGRAARTTEAKLEAR